DKSEERYRTLAEAALDQIYIIGDDNHVQYVNNYAARMFNKTPDEIIGTRHADLFPPDVAQEQRRMLNKVIRTGEPVYVENPTPFVDDEIWLGTRLVPLRNADGRVSSVLGISRDITERIRAEEALKESERKFRLVVEQSRDGIFIGTLDGRVVLYNNAMKEISGYAMEEVNEAGWFDLVYADLKQRVEAIVLVVRAFREELSYFEHQITRKDGKRAWISVSIRPITIEGRKYLLGMTTDITKRKLAENDLKRAYETEHRIAATLQESLIRAVPAVPGLDIGILYRSAFDAEMIGGDFYDIFELDNDLVAVLIGDVAGRGIKAAGLTETIRSSIRTLAYIDPSPAFALNQTNQSLLRQLPPSQTATAAFLLLDMRNGDVRFASAGHPRLIVRRQDHCEVLDGPKALPLGMFASGFEETYLSLEEGQGLLLCTDGLIEALGGAVPLAEDRIAKILGRLASETAQDEVEDLLMATSEYAEGIFKDDITIVSIKFSKRRGKGDQEAS
ncbi:MAG: PAS domain S-box protein, partial [Chloroflexi bacterium]|nr:PAS domain S-box protein [Chloroflexota bacterium]